MADVFGGSGLERPRIVVGSDGTLCPNATELKMHFLWNPKLTELWIPLASKVVQKRRASGVDLKIYIKYLGGPITFS